MLIPDISNNGKTTGFCGRSDLAAPAVARSHWRSAELGNDVHKDTVTRTYQHDLSVFSSCIVE